MNKIEDIKKSIVAFNFSKEELEALYASSSALNSHYLILSENLKNKIVEFLKYHIVYLDYFVVLFGSADKLEKIKRVRQELQCSLADAKNLVDLYIATIK